MDRNSTILAFFSRSGENYKVGNVGKGSGRIIAEIIEDITGVPAYEIARAEDYPEEYEECNKEARKERDENARPALRNALPEMKSTSKLILVYPNWWGDLPMPVYTFLDGIKTDGLEIYPVCTHEGNGIGFTEKCIAQVYPEAKVMKGLALRGSEVQAKGQETEKAVREYLASHSLI